MSVPVCITLLAGAGAFGETRLAGERLDLDPAGGGVSSSCLPRVAASARRLHVVWQDARDGEWAIYERASTADVDAFELHERRLSAKGSHALDPRIVASGGCVHVVWRTVPREGATGGEAVAAVTSLDGGTGWSAIAALRPAGAAASDFVSPPELFADELGAAVAVWVAAVGDRDVAQVAVHGGPGSRWSGPTTIGAADAAMTRTSAARAVLVARGGIVPLQLLVATVEHDASGARLVVRGSQDGGATFPDELATTLFRGPVQGAIELAAQREHVHLLWSAADDLGKPRVLAQRSEAGGAPRSWLAQPVRVDDAARSRVALYDLALTVTEAGDAFAAYVAAEAEERGGVRIELAATALPAQSATGAGWSPERILGAPQRGLPAPIRVRPRLRAHGRGAAIVWTEDPAASSSASRLWIATIDDASSPAVAHPLEASVTADAPRADAADVVLRTRDGRMRAAIVWDDRRYWSLPGAEAGGRGAPEPFFLDFAFP